MARPKIVWNEKQYASIEYMALIHCTQKEISGVMGVDEDTLNRLIRDNYGLSFSEWYEKYSANGNMSLRRAQFRSAENGNTSMQIWLGKQWLGQREVVDNNISTDGQLGEILKFMRLNKEDID